MCFPTGTEFSLIMNATSISLLISQPNADGGGNELPSIENAIGLLKLTLFFFLSALV